MSENEQFNLNLALHRVLKNLKLLSIPSVLQDGVITINFNNHIISDVGFIRNLFKGTKFYNDRSWFYIDKYQIMKPQSKLSYYKKEPEFFKGLWKKVYNRNFWLRLIKMGLTSSAGYYIGRYFNKAGFKVKNNKTYYDVLNVKKNANSDEIRKAYKNLARIHHPDKNNGQGDEKFKELQNAYEHLKDSRKRSLYNNFLNKY